MDTALQERDRIVSTGERPVKPDKLTEQPLSPKDERIVSANPSPDAVIVGPSRDIMEQQESSEAAGDLSTVHPHNAYVSHEQNVSYGGYVNTTGLWDGYSQYVNSDGMHVVSPVMYNDNPSVVFHSGYGFNPDMAYGQYSPVATPLPSLMVDGQLYSPQQVPFSPSYYGQAAAPSLPHMSADLMVPESSSIDTMLFGPGPGYLASFGSFGGGNLSGNLGSSPLTSPVAYSQPMGILGSYEHNVGQVSQQQRQMHGYGLVSSSFSGRYPHGSSNQSSTFGGASISYPVANDRNRLALDKGRRRERDRDSISIFNDPQDIFNDRNRGPRATKLRSKSATEQGSSSVGKNVTPGNHLDSYNQLDFVTDYENAKFFIIKSFSEDNVHKSIKYNVWASTPHGNKKLDAAYHEAKEIKGNCPVFLLFSVNASGQFCGVAEMIGPVDFERDADYWQQDRWSGQFSVRWRIIKDVPNIRFRHILLENNDNKPVTHSRDSQEVTLKEGIEMLKIFKDYDARTTIIDDFEFYDDRERVLKERKARQQASSTTDVPDSLANESVNQISDSFAQALKLEESSNKVPATEQGGSSRSDAPLSLSLDSGNQISDSLSRVLRLEESNHEVPASETGGGHKN